MIKRVINQIISIILVITLIGGIINVSNSQAKSNLLQYFDDFSTYTPGLLPTGWLHQGASEVIPTIQEVGGTGPDYRLVDFPERFLAVLG